MVLKLTRIGAIIVFILGIVFIFIAVILGEHPPHNPSVAYNAIKHEIYNSVANDADNHNGSLPTLSSTYTNANCSNCSVINISALLTTNGGTLRDAPDGLNLSASGHDNCGGNASLGCNKYSSYIWIVDANGSVFSYCAGTGCATNDSGYQGVWP